MPITTSLDQFRLELGDTDSTHPLFNDDEAQYFIDQRPGSVLFAVADACDALARRFSAEFDFETDGQRFQRSQKAKAYQAQAAALRARAAKAGGITVVPTGRVDGYSQDLDTRDVTGGTDSVGRARHGYYDNDMPA